MATPNIVSLLKDDGLGNTTEDLTNGVLPKVDGSNLTGVIGNTYIASVDPIASDDGFGNSITFPDTVFNQGQSWFNYTTERLYFCVSATNGAARWVENFQTAGSLFTFLGGSTAIDKGAIVTLTTGGSGTLSIVTSALDTDDAIVGAAAQAASGPTNLKLKAVSVGITDCIAQNGTEVWTRGDKLYLSSSIAGTVTVTPSAKLIGFASEDFASGPTARRMFVGIGSGGGGGPINDLHTIMQNKSVISSNYNLANVSEGDPENYNGVAAGPLTINSGVTLTIPLGSRLVVL